MKISIIFLKKITAVGFDFLCPMKNICERDFETIEDVMAHLQIVHKVDKQEIMSEYWYLNKKHSEFRCPYKFCSEDFKKINELTYHIQISHLDKKEFFTSGITHV